MIIMINLIKFMSIVRLRTKATEFYVYVVQQNYSSPLVRCERALVHEIVAILILNCGTTLASASPTDLFNLERGQALTALGGQHVWAGTFGEEKNSLLLIYLFYVTSDI